MELEWVEPEPAPARTSRKSWHAVAIVPPNETCAAVQGVTGRRFLSRDAPRLPLRECTRQANCRCTYRHYADRRAGPRRVNERTGMPVRYLLNGELRRTRGRRATDV